MKPSKEICGNMASGSDIKSLEHTIDRSVIQDPNTSKNVAVPKLPVIKIKPVLRNAFNLATMTGQHNSAAQSVIKIPFINSLLYNLNQTAIRKLSGADIVVPSTVPAKELAENSAENDNEKKSTIILSREQLENLAMKRRSALRATDTAEVLVETNTYKSTIVLSREKLEELAYKRARRKEAMQKDAGTLDVKSKQQEQIKDISMPSIIKEIEMKETELTPEINSVIGNVTSVSPETHQASGIALETFTQKKPKMNRIYYCKPSCDNHQDLYEVKYDDIVRLGDTFDSPEEFIAYTNARGKKWLFYFNRVNWDNHLKHKLIRVRYHCCFKNRKFLKYIPKGLRKRKQYKTDCPCTLLLHQQIDGRFLVVQACYHHDHEMSLEMLAKLPSRYNFVSSLTINEFKEEIRDLASLDLDNAIIYKYMEDKVGKKLNHAMIYNHIIKLKSNKDNMKRQFKFDKLKSLLQKIKELNEQYGPKIKTDNEEQSSKSETKSNEPFKIYEGLLEIQKRKKALELLALENSKKPKRIRNKKKRPPPSPTEEFEDINQECKKSRLETTLENISDNAEVLESVRNLQKSVGDRFNASKYFTRFCDDEYSLNEEQYSEELNSPVTVYATTDTRDNTNIVVYNNDEYYNNTEAMEINEMGFNELAIATEIEVESTVDPEYSSYQENVDQKCFGDQMDETTFQESDPIYYEIIPESEIKNDEETRLDVTSDPCREDNITIESTETKHVRLDSNNYDVQSANIEKEFQSSDENHSVKMDWETESTVSLGQDPNNQYKEEPTDKLIKNDSNSSGLNTTSKTESTYSGRFAELTVKHEIDANEVSDSPIIYTTVINDPIRDFCRQECLKMSGKKIKLVDKSTQVDIDLVAELEMRREIILDFQKTLKISPPRKLKDTIINKHNIESFIVQPDISKEIENLSVKMSMSVMDILKNIYTGQAVLVKNKVSDLNIFMYKHLPDKAPISQTITDDDYLGQYRNICSQYSNTCFHLTDTVQKMRQEINVLKRRLKDKIEDARQNKITRNSKHLKRKDMPI